MRPLVPDHQRHGMGGVSMLHGVAQQVGEDLAHPGRIEHQHHIGWKLGDELPLGIGRADLVEGLLAQRTQVAFLWNHFDAAAEPGARVFEQVGDHVVDRRNASPGDLERALLGPGLACQFEKMNAGAERAQRVSQVVSQHGQEGVPGIGHVLRIGGHGLGKALVDAFVEAHHFFEDRGIDRADVSHPQTKNRGPQRAVFRAQLGKVETHPLAQATVFGGKSLLEERQRKSLGLCFALPFRLGRFHFAGNGQQDFMRMVPQFDNGHGLRRRDHRSCKGFPLDEDGFDVVLDELAQAHAGGVCARVGQQEVRPQQPLPGRWRKRVLDEAYPEAPPTGTHAMSEQPLSGTDPVDPPFFHEASGTVRFWVLIDGQHMGASISKDVLRYRFRPGAQGDDPMEIYAQYADQLEAAVRRRAAQGSIEPVMLREFDLPRG